MHHGEARRDGEAARVDQHGLPSRVDRDDIVRALAGGASEDHTMILRWCRWVGVWVRVLVVAPAAGIVSLYSFRISGSINIQDSRMVSSTDARLIVKLK